MRCVFVPIQFVSVIIIIIIMLNIEATMKMHISSLTFRIILLLHHRIIAYKNNGIVVGTELLDFKAMDKVIIYSNRKTTHLLSC
jgi:hypothetical protein